MDETRLKPRKSQSFQVVRCEVCGAEVVIDKARGAQCPKCGAGRENPASSPPADEGPKINNPMPTAESAPSTETPEKMPSRRIQSWRSAVSDPGRVAPRYGNRSYTDPRGPKPPERETKPEGRPRPDRFQERNSERGFDRNAERHFDRGPSKSDRGPSKSDRGFDRTSDRPPYRDRGPERGSSRGGDRGGERGFHRGPERGPNRDRGNPRNQGPRYSRNEPRRPLALDIAPEVKREILATWEALRQQEERPPEGRRMRIANQFGLTFDQVTAVIKEQPRGREAKPAPRPKPPDPLESMDPIVRRDVGFQIEKAYFAELESSSSKRPWKLVLRSVARRVRKPEALVSSWLQMLHRKSKRMIRAQRPDEATTARIIEAYQNYLQADKPPEMSLHKSLAALIGAKQRQIHRVLFEYRWRLRNQTISGPPMMLAELEAEQPPSPTSPQSPGDQEKPPANES